MENDNKLFLNPNEMALRKIYWPLAEAEKITKIFRPGNRPCGRWRGYCSGQKVTIQVLDKVGADWAQLSPRFVDGLSKEVLISEVTVKRIKDLDSADFAGTTPDIYNQDSLRYNLGIIYNLFPEEVGLDSFVTITTFTYV